MSKTKTKGSLGMQWLTTGVSTTLVLVLLGIISFFILFARNLSDEVKENLVVTVLVSDATTADELDALKREISESGYTTALQYVSKEQALAEQVAAMGTDPSEFLGTNPFTASLEMRMDAAYANSDSLSWIIASIRRNACVEDVIYQKDLTDAVNRNLQRISYILLVLAVLLTMVSTALINNTIKLSVHSGRFVIRTMMLIGADWSVIRRPFMWRSFRLGCLSACSACAVLWGSVFLLLHHDATLQPYITTDMMWLVSAVVLTFGLLLTGCSTYFSVNGFLKRKASELY